MDNKGLFRRRMLPHLDVEGKPFFITACLHGSLPAAGLRQISQYREELDRRTRPPGISEQEWEVVKQKLIFKRVDSILDGGSPVSCFKDERLANIVKNAFLHFADERYRLFAFVVMPSHHHWVFLPDDGWSQKFVFDQKDCSRRRSPREAISHSIQSYTASQCNRVLGRTGTFWQGETFDHFVRDEDELLRVIHYIEQNPVAAGLAKEAADYLWSSATLRLRLGVRPGESIPKVK